MYHILFLCVANSARSQIAEGLARHILAGVAQVHSAGSSPSGVVHPLAVEVMQEKGIDMGAHTSKAISDIDDTFMNNLDYVITLCAEEVCPVLMTRARKLHWPYPDPAGAGGGKEKQKEAFRLVRDGIAKELEKFARRLAA